MQVADDRQTEFLIHLPEIIHDDMTSGGQAETSKTYGARAFVVIPPTRPDPDGFPPGRPFFSIFIKLFLFKLKRSPNLFYFELIFS